MALCKTCPSYMDSNDDVSCPRRAGMNKKAKRWGITIAVLTCKEKPTPFDDESIKELNETNDNQAALDHLLKLENEAKEQTENKSADGTSTDANDVPGDVSKKD